MRLATLLILTPLVCVRAGGDVALPGDSPRLVYSTYVGTGGGSTLNGLAVDSTGAAYAAGSGPGTTYLPNCGYLTKLNPSGQSADWSICLGPTRLDGVAVDPSGAVYVIGTSPDTSSAEPYTPPSTVIKLAAADQSIVYSVQLQGAYANRIAVDSSGNTYISGRADSTFVPTAGAYSANTNSQTFAAKLNPDGSVAYATYLDMLSTQGVAISSAGEFWLVGNACPASSHLVSCSSVTNIGFAAAVRKLDPSGATTSVSLTFGGGRRSGGDGSEIFDVASGIALDGSGAAWVGGTNSSLTVPTTPDALEPGSLTGAGNNSGYLIKLSPAGAVLYGTYLSPPLIHGVSAVALDATGNVVLGDADAGAGPALANLIALSADGRTPQFSITSYVTPTLAVGNGFLYAASTGCNTTPRAYQPFVPLTAPLGFGVGQINGCVSKFDVTQFSRARVNYPLAATTVPQVPPGMTVSQQNTIPTAGMCFAPGELITLYGENLPLYPTVSFDGIPAPVIASDTGRLATVVPFHVSATLSALEIGSVRGFNLQVCPYMPSLFTADGSGIGQLNALNQDGSANSKDNPADVGSVVRVYMTGAGTMVPELGDGEVGPKVPPFPQPLLPISARVGGVQAVVAFAAQAPGLTAGIVAVDIQIPASTPSGDAKVVVFVDNDTNVPRFPQTTTVAVR